MSEKLKPCPFCGSRAVVCCTADYGYIVRCDGDDCQCCCPTTWYCNTEEQAIETWNRRAGDNESERKQDASERECENCKHVDDGKLVSRQAVLNLVKMLRFPNIKGLEHYGYRCIDPNEVMELPTVQAEADIISRQTAIDALDCINGAEEVLRSLPAAQPKHDIPMKPRETTDRAWGIPKKQAVCPNCDYYLGHVAFLDDYKGKRVTYCETCGQAIDWEGWDFDE